MLLVDSINVVNSLEDAPDKLRAEIGRYYSSENHGPHNTNFAFYRSGIKRDFIHNFSDDTSALIPVKRSRIFVSGREEQFRDQTQWKEYITDTIKTEVSNLDHQCDVALRDVESSFIKNYHDPTYEDFTKTYATNQLLNYNLVDYPHKSQADMVQKIGDLRTGFDSEEYIVDSHYGIKELIKEFPNRIVNYSGSIEEVDIKQRNIFDLHLSGHLISKGLDSFPFYYRQDLDSPIHNDLSTLMRQYGKSINIFQSIKQDLAFSNRGFNIGEVDVEAKIHNLLDICLSTRIVSAIEQQNELFLPPSDQAADDFLSRRFLDQYNAVQFFGGLKGLLTSRARNIEEVFDSVPGESFFIGYKIEKYLDNTAGLPIQTYYTTSERFYDTQLKYGRSYTYKTKVLIGILGSSYRYTNLHISRNETEMVSESGILAESSPSGFIDIVNEKYRAYVDVEVTPSFQILEYEVASRAAVFVDTQPPRPQVEFQVGSKKGHVDFFFSPMLFLNRSFGYDGQGSGFEDDLYDIVTEEDQETEFLLQLGSGLAKPFDYFTGIYEIYRTDIPPTRPGDFQSSLVATIDDQSSLAYPSTMALPPFSLDNMNGYYSEKIHKNKKYYYLFRALSYHGTPSNTTGPFCVELMEDSDGFKVSVEEYHYAPPIDYENRSPVKRLVRLVPNVDRLAFSLLEKDGNGIVSYKLDDGKMLNKGFAKKIKLRVTSKHTGKKMDININLVLKEDTNSFN